MFLAARNTGPNPKKFDFCFGPKQANGETDVDVVLPLDESRAFFFSRETQRRDAKLIKKQLCCLLLLLPSNLKRSSLDLLLP